jgi:hypothetical protein
MHSIASRIANSPKQVWDARSKINAHRWNQGLPANWEYLVIVPLVFEIQREYEVAATRVIGQDTGGASCYCSYHYIRTELGYNDDDVLYEAVVYAEEQSGWRLSDGRWLVRRSLATRDDCENPRVDFCLSEKMPR